MARLLPKRFHRSDLSDNQVLILDWYAMLGGSTPATQDEYSTHMNCRYTHSIPDSELDGRHRELADEGLLRSELSTDGPSQGYTIYYLTSRGGQVWSEERGAIWDRFCHATGSMPEGSMILTVRTRTDTLSEEYLAAALAANLHKIDHSSVDKSTVQDRLRPWRNIEELSSITARCIEDSKDSLGVDWDVYESKRTWWGHLEELQMFLG